MIEINGLKIREGQLRYLLYRTFWKQTRDANLNTVSGCEQAAEVALRLLADIDDEWDIGHIPEKEPYIFNDR